LKNNLEKIIEVISKKCNSLNHKRKRVKIDDTISNETSDKLNIITNNDNIEEDLVKEKENRSSNWNL
ncbi:6676_t:CDS:1, partial [Racocetra persica]